MRFSTRRLRLWNTIVLVTMLFATLAPGLARAFDDASSGAIQVCTSTGIFFVAGSDLAEGDGPADEAAQARAQCVFCLAGAHAGAVPVALRITPPYPEGVDPVPSRNFSFPPALAVVRPAQPRAPPASC